MKREPLAISGAVVAAILAIVQVAIAFGADIDPEQYAALSTALSTAAIAVVVVWSRGKVTPVADPRLDDE